MRSQINFRLQKEVKDRFDELSDKEGLFKTELFSHLLSFYEKHKDNLPVNDPPVDVEPYEQRIRELENRVVDVVKPYQIENNGLVSRISHLEKELEGSQSKASLLQSEVDELISELDAMPKDQNEIVRRILLECEGIDCEEALAYSDALRESLEGKDDETKMSILYALSTKLRQREYAFKIMLQKACSECDGVFDTDMSKMFDYLLNVNCELGNWVVSYQDFLNKHEIKLPKIVKDFSCFQVHDRINPTSSSYLDYIKHK